jgi:hypothetical protein
VAAALGGAPSRDFPIVKDFTTAWAPDLAGLPMVKAFTNRTIARGLTSGWRGCDVSCRRPAAVDDVERAAGAEREVLLRFEA